jgi:hypothetical protein
LPCQQRLVPAQYKLVVVLDLSSLLVKNEEEDEEKGENELQAARGAEF